MKKTCMIIVLAIGVCIAASSSAWAQAIYTTGAIRFTDEVVLTTAQMPSCGNGIFETGPNNQPVEECEFDTNTGEELTQESFAVGAIPVCTAPETCNHDTCMCDPPPPICGDGQVSHGMGEQCESIGSDGEAYSADKITMLCQRTRTAGRDVPLSSAYSCVDCICKTCGNGVLDTDLGEQCEQDSDCQENMKCVDCACVEGEEVAVTGVPQTQCTVKVYGFSNDASEKMVQSSLNARVHEILGTDSIDLFGEEIYSRFVAQIRFYDSVTKSDTQLDASIMSKLIKDVGLEVNMTSTAVIKYNGGYESSLSEMTFRPMSEDHIMTPVLLFPRGSATDVTMGKSLAGKDLTFITPDLSAAGIVLQTDVGFMGDINMKVVDESEMSMNDTIRFKVVPHVPSKVGEVAPKEVLVEGFLRPAPASFLGGGDLVPMDPAEVLARLEIIVAEWKEAGREIDCDIMAALTGLKYAPTMRSTFLVASDTIDIKTGGAGPLQTKAFGVFAVRTEAAYGGKGVGCSLTAVQAHVPQVAVLAGLLAASLGVIGIVRRRKQ